MNSPGIQHLLFFTMMEFTMEKILWKTNCQIFRLGLVYGICSSLSSINLSLSRTWQNNKLILVPAIPTQQQYLPIIPEGIVNVFRHLYDTGSRDQKQVHFYLISPKNYVYNSLSQVIWNCCILSFQWKEKKIWRVLFNRKFVTYWYLTGWLVSGFQNRICSCVWKKNKEARFSGDVSPLSVNLKIFYLSGALSIQHSFSCNHSTKYCNKRECILLYISIIVTFISALQYLAVIWYYDQDFRTKILVLLSF